MWHQVKLGAVMLAILFLAGNVARGDFFDNFDSYETGSEMHGQGDWKGWDNDPAFSAPTSDTYSFSSPNSVEIGANADLVHEFSTTGGIHRFSTMQYIPTDSTTGSTFFVLLNQYVDNDTSNYNDWSVNLFVDLGAGEIYSFEDSSAVLPIVRDEWVEIRFDIDLDNNLVTSYYDGTLLTTHEWDDTDHNTLEAVDLFGNGASEVYYDNVSLTEIPEPTSLTIMVLGLVLGALVIRYRQR